MNKPESIEEYIRSFNPQIQKLLREMRQTIQESAPDAIESISYDMPTFKLHGVLVHFAAFTNHIGFYALPSENVLFMKELSVYKTGKGSVQFPVDQPLPLELISKIVKFRVQENIKKETTRKKK